MSADTGIGSRVHTSQCVRYDDSRSEERMAGRSRDGGGPVRTLVVYLVYLLTLLGSYCRMAPAIAGAVRGWEMGSEYKYTLDTTVIFREAGPTRSGGDVGFKLTGELDVAAVWRDPGHPDNFLLSFELSSPQLWIKSRRAPEPEGFVEHTSKVNQVAEGPFFVLWQHGRIINLYMDTSEEDASSANLKRGLASLFQYRTLDDDARDESDASGLCGVTYESTGPRSFVKRKTDCKPVNFPSPTRHPDPTFGVRHEDVRNSTYVLTQALLPERVVEHEAHATILSSRSDVGTTVVSDRTAQLVSTGAKTKPIVEADSVKDAIMKLKPGYDETTVELQPESVACQDAECLTISKTIEKHSKALAASMLGKARSASAFLNLMPLVKAASQEELQRILKSPRNYNIRMQLLDVYGFASTLPAHKAVMNILKQDDSGEEIERYLWALSLSPTPCAKVFNDVLKRSEQILSNNKVSETYALTAGAMARRFDSATMKRARLSLELGLATCTADECRLKFLRALRNLKHPDSIDVLLRHTSLEESRVVSVAAWRGLAALPRRDVTDRLREAAFATFLQTNGQRRDSSVRTLALDVILESGPSRGDLQVLVEYLGSNDQAYEVRKYLSQRLEQIADRDETFAGHLDDIYANGRARLNNYNAMAQRGLSTAFNRCFLRSTDSNGSLVTVQEVNSGLLKRGSVDVVLTSNGHRRTLFSLGLFANGLSSFVSSDEATTDDDETATAGMEIDVLGVGVRPFVFFYGQGELVGHTWSGTASTRTPAFQILASLHGHSRYVPLGSGFVAEIDVRGAASFDLAGQIQLSLWSRNAQSLVEMGAGVMIQSTTKVRTSFVTSRAESTMTMEPKLELSTNVDFAGSTALCMKLNQLESRVRHHVYKIERISGSRHRLRKTRQSSVLLPGKSYRLNRKNDEMCTKVFS